MTKAPKISVLGGAGFIGTALCQRLYEHQVPFEIIDLKQSQRFPEKSKIADVRDIDSLRAGITGDVVVNLAAVHRDDVSDANAYYENNVVGAQNIAEVCTEKAIHKIIFTSTVAVYGFTKSRTGEDGDINPFNEYGKSKFAAERILQDWFETSMAKNSLFIVRPTVVCGEGNRGNVYNLLNQIASGRFVMIGAGTNKKSMAYVGNLAAFLHTCISTGHQYGLYNYTDEPDLDMNTLVSLVKSRLGQDDGVGPRLPYWLGLVLGYCADGLSGIIGKRLPVSSIRVRKFCADTEFASAKDTLDGFVPPYSLKEGIERILHSEFVDPDSRREVFYTE